MLSAFDALSCPAVELYLVVLVWQVALAPPTLAGGQTVAQLALDWAALPRHQVEWVSAAKETYRP